MASVKYGYTNNLHNVPLKWHDAVSADGKSISEYGEWIFEKILLKL